MCTPYIECQKWLPWQRPLAPMEPHPTHNSYGPSELTTQTASLSVQPSLNRRPYSVRIIYNGTPLPPIKIALSHRGIWTPISNTWFPGPTRVLNPNCISIDSAVSAGLTSVTDRPTDRPTDRSTDRPRCSVGNNRPHLRRPYLRAMR